MGGGVSREGIVLPDYPRGHDISHYKMKRMSFNAKRGFFTFIKTSEKK